MKKAILQWFADDCPFRKGVEIYRQVGGVTPISYFERYQQARFLPDAVDNRLQYLLRSALETLRDEEDVSITKTTQADGVSEFATIVQKTDIPEPISIQQLRQEAKGIHKRHSFIHAQMVMADSDEKRYECAKEIMLDIIPALDALYDRIRAWQETGELPAVAAPSKDRDEYVITKMLRRNSLKSRLSRLGSLLKKTTLSDGERAKYQKELLEKEVELKGIEEEFDRYL